MIFVDLRDRTGVLQLVIKPQVSGAQDLSLQDCIYAVGDVLERPEGQKNPGMVTGDVELSVVRLETLGKSKVPPFVVENEVKANEELNTTW